MNSIVVCKKMKTVKRGKTNKKTFFRILRLKGFDKFK